MTAKPVDKLYVLPTAQPWMVSLKFGFGETFVAYLKTIPGARWSPAGRYWLFPIEMLSQALKVAEAHDLVVDNRVVPTRELPSFVVTGLHQYQLDAINASTELPAWLFNEEMGLGKSVEAISATRTRLLKRGIIVVPAVARRNWFNPKKPAECELGKWWPEHPEAQVIENGKKARESTADIRIVSYHLLSKLNPELPVDFIFYDEAHYLQNPDTSWSKAARKLNNLHPDAFRAGMTGTLITNDPMSMHNTLDTLWPGRFGTVSQFGRRYSKAINNGYGTIYKGVNEENVPELQARLHSMSSRTTKREVAHLLPAFLCQLAWVNPDKRVEEAVEWARTMHAQGAEHVTILCHLRETARKLCAAAAAEGGSMGKVCAIDGEIPAHQRLDILHQQRDSGRGSTTIATLHSVNVGIDMTFSPNVCFAEIYQRPVEMIQVLGRFHRLTSKEPVTATILAAEGGDKEAESLFLKIQAINALIKAGSAESGLASAMADLKSLGLTDEEIQAALMASTEEWIP